MGKNLFGYQGIKPVLASLTAIALVHTLSIIMLAIWLAEAISALFAGAAWQEQAGKIGLFLLAFLVRQLTALLQQKVAYRFAEKTGASLRSQLLEALFRLGPRHTRTEGTGTTVTLVLEGVGKFRKYMELFLPRMIGSAVTPVLILAYIATQDIVAALILAVTMPILIAFLILVGLAARKQTEKQWASYRQLSNHFVDSLRGLETLKFLGRSRSHGATVSKVSDRYRSATMRTLRVAFLSSFSLDFFTMLSVASVAVSLGLRLVEGEMMLVTALTILILAPEYFLPVRMVGADYHATLDGKEAGEAMQAIIRAGAQSEPAPASQALPAWTQDSVLQMSGIGMRHEEEGPSSLQEIDLEIQGFRKVGIIGASGAGKSTLIDIIGGFLHPTAGTIRVDGQERTSLTGEDWRKQTTYIPQHPYIFSSSLADNVRFYSPDATDDEVARAMAAAGLGQLAEQLPNGLDERIGNGGRSLSGGQEQRVALARAFLSRRPVMLLDEPTAHLDIETEYELKSTMLDLFRDRLVFLATHRLHWMPDMDWIIVLQDGKVAETGTHEELLAKRGAYYDMIRTEGEETL
ncbi:thiol reductant ABC exporter subunit CydD [Paenibacillus melissococcoides]|uniref:Thiol reductant ABC exporter subunit CydD n=1 Tax=Paenibacillus melissococcoides TaxID=2912268 RepID=A0ABM9FZ24_9BACL|nr:MULTISPECIES: thiol reductant ABC exporter subunit CydD [Paenibacillus]MEB9894713.1 thiol reductant ABC exporter subunit CydD [Bacillus cereus]CAH8244498.1 thiol reductant ABC exporter subunit CydD [Paenibacillus melissococcoides]CAH8708160.1 thiol reductant ABC exporter subunit CydD [Paenibacillus melissococcoides]CAH8708866.1 thiol reductant ABC exporter subunit CydD [Paenibacillus melissococcoides]GIO80411.1 ATP-binding/permease protein CydC [Paenibacillus dendritiformis]